MSLSTLRIATRKSALALWQAEHVAMLLRAAHPGLNVELLPLSTRGDEILDQPLATIGGKGLFLKELGVAMLEGRAQLAVHSLKDVPARLEPGFTLAAILPRADAADAFVSNHYSELAALPQGARVGTSSLRRQAQLRALRPDLQVRDLRGNVGTRLRKLDAGDYDAIVLACAGLERLGLAARIVSRLAAPDWLPAPGLGRQLHRAGRRLVRAGRTRPAPARPGRRCRQRSAAARRGQRPGGPGRRAGRTGGVRAAGTGRRRVSGIARDSRIPNPGPKSCTPDSSSSACPSSSRPAARRCCGVPGSLPSTPFSWSC